MHKNRGRKPKHALLDETRQKIVTLYQSEKYRGSNDHHFAQLLAEHEGIVISPSTVRRILRDAGIKSVRKRRSKKVYQPRQRKAQEGMLIQMDASKHAWIEGVEPFTLFGAIDDATGKVVGATFRQNEDLKGYLQITQKMIEVYGVPLAVYTDCHSIFRSSNEKLTVEQELDGIEVPLSQYGQAMDELGITHIKAHSPQAKGRVERLFQTLQDRLIIELRVRKVKTMAEANEVLQELIHKHNSSFAKPARDKHTAYVPYTHSTPLHRILCFREGDRKIGSGQTISLHGKVYKLKVTDSPRILPLKTAVEVRKTLDNDLLARFENDWFTLVSCDAIPNTVPVKQPIERAGSQRQKPAPNHPWRQYRVKY